MDGKKIIDSRDVFFPLALTIVMGVFYGATLAPGYAWSNYGVDGGDLIAAAATGGVAHPTGYPLYLLLARAFQAIPFGPLAFRTNLMSAVMTILASLTVYLIVFRLSPSTWNVHQKRVGGWLAGLAFGLSPIVWSQAVVTEVYALHGFMVAVIVYTASVHTRHPRHGFLLPGFVLGLAMGNHVTAILNLPVLLLCVVGEKGDLRFWTLDWAAWRRICRRGVHFLLGMAVGLSVYCLVFVWSRSNAPVNWGRVVNLERFIWLVSGQMYMDRLVPLTWSVLANGSKAIGGLLLSNLGWLGILLGCIGAVVFFIPSRFYWVTFWIFVSSLVFSSVYDTSDSFLYLIPALLVISIWMGVAASGVQMLLLQRHPVISILTPLLILAVFLTRVFINLPDVDASHDYQAEVYWQGIDRSAPTGAIIFAEGDRAVFTGWYFHFALKRRDDLRIIAIDLLDYDWYRESLHAAYTDLVIPRQVELSWIPEIAAANPGRPICFSYSSNLNHLPCDITGDP